MAAFTIWQPPSRQVSPKYDSLFLTTCGKRPGASPISSKMLSFVLLSFQLTRSMRLYIHCSAAMSFFSFAVDNIEASAPLETMGHIRVFTNFTFTVLSICRLFQISVSSSVSLFAIAIRVLMSFKQSPNLVSTEPRYLKIYTSSIATPFTFTSCLCSSRLLIRISLVFFTFKLSSFVFPASFTLSTSSSMSLSEFARSAVSSASGDSKVFDHQRPFLDGQFQHLS